mgnify:FL=1
MPEQVVCDLEGLLFAAKQQSQITTAEVSAETTRVYVRRAENEQSHNEYCSHRIHDTVSQACHSCCVTVTWGPSCCYSKQSRHEYQHSSRVQS